MAFNVGQVESFASLNIKGFMTGIKTIYREGLNTSSRVGKEFQRLGDQLSKVGMDMTKKLTLPLVAFGGLALRTAGNFEASMNRVSAITGATGVQLSRLEKVARQLGATTQFSASQAAGAMSFLAMAGFEVNEITSAMPSVLNLAAAAQLDMASSADIASNIMSGFAMTAEQLEGAVDVLAKQFTSANTNLEQLGEAMKMVGPVAQGFGMDFEEASAAVGLLSDAGIQGSMAGTQLRRILITMSREAKRLGVTTFDAAGNMRSMADIIADIEEVGLSSTKAMEIFGDRGGPGMQVLLSRGSDALREMTKELQNAGGTAQEIAEKQMEGLNGTLKELRSAFEELQIAIAQSGILDFATNFAKSLTSITQALGRLNPSVLKFGSAIAVLLASMGPGLWLLGAWNRALGSMMVMLPKLVKGQLALNAAMKANVFLLAASGIAAIGIAAFNAKENMKELRNETQRLIDLDMGSLSLDVLNQQIIEISNKIQDISRASFTLFGIDFEKGRIAELRGLLDELVAKRNELAQKQMDNLIDSRAAQDITDTNEALQGTEQVVRRISSLAAERPLDDIVDPLRIMKPLDMMQWSMEDLLDLNTRLGKEMETTFHPDSLGALNQKLQELQVQMLYAFDPAVQQALREEMKLTKEQIDTITGSTRNATFEGYEFASTMGNALAQATLHGRNLQQVMDNLIKQFGARTFITGIAALATGGASLGGQSFLSNVFGGIFHSGGKVPGVGDKTIIARGGEHILTPSQMDAMMQPAKVSGSQSMNIRITGNLTGRGDELLAIIDERIRQNGRVL